MTRCTPTKGCGCSHPGSLSACQQLRGVRFSGGNSTGPVSTLAARKFHDILHPAARVQELRNRGHLIDTVWADDVTAEGNVHRVALYLYRGKAGA
ncbi:helix-turn-helix domain-containing protein [Solidesulfovibrio sp.]